MGSKGITPPEQDATTMSEGTLDDAIIAAGQQENPGSGGPIGNIRGKTAKDSRDAIKKKKEPPLPAELLPYKQEMEAWIGSHMDTVRFFLEDAKIPLDIIYGEWFWYHPKTNRICLGVQAFRDAKEAYKEELNEGRMTIDQILFSFFHEVAHAKVTRQQDRAGKVNLLEFFKYVSRKRIESKDQPGKFLSPGPTYAHFYNILEDAIVNRMALNTRHFSQPAIREKIREAYITPFFALYRKAEDGKGNYKKTIDQKKEVKFEQVKDGEGEYVLLKEDDYKKGFDVSGLEHMEKLTSQVLTFFIKSQMGVMKESDIGGRTEHTDGKFTVDDHAAAVFREPLNKVYKRLFTALLDKYRAEPDKLKRYLDFMSQGITVPRYTEQKGKIVKQKDEIFWNVFSIEKRKLPESSLVNQSWFSYLQNLKNLGIPGADKMSFMELFEQFKKINPFPQKGFTLPFKIGYSDRTDIIRTALEPIFTMLCVLDDSFDMDMPAEGKPGEPGEPGDDDEDEDEARDKPKGPPPEEADLNAPWDRGVEVINNDRSSPNYGKHGVIESVIKDEDGNVIEVEVNYFDIEDSAVVKVAINGREVNFNGVAETVSDPVKNLIIVRRKKKTGQPEDEGNKSPIKCKYLDDEDKDDKDDPDGPPDKNRPKGGEKSEDDDDGNPDSDNDESDDVPDEGDEADEDEKNKPESSEENSNQPKPDEAKKSDEDLRKLFGKMIDYIEDEMEKEDIEDNKEALNKAKETMDYRNKKAAQSELDKIARLIERAHESNLSNKPLTAEERKRYRELIKEYQELENEAEPWIKKMAEEWSKYIDNIVQEIQLLKDKYYKEGKVDIKRLQRHFPEIEFGANIDEMRIREKWIERIKTELRPKMLRLHLLADNSGSMVAYIRQMKMAILLLNGSLRALRELFRTKMKKVLGGDYTPDLDLVCDTRLSLFGNSSRTIKGFDITDLRFLSQDPKEIRKLPEIDAYSEAVSTIMAFEKLTVDEATYDGDFWPDLAKEYHEDPKLLQAISENKLTDVLIQVSDGAISSADPKVLTEYQKKSIYSEEDSPEFKRYIKSTDKKQIRYIKFLKERCGLRIGGFAIGPKADPENPFASANSALASLARRHGEANVIEANSAEEIATGMSRFLSQVVQREVQKPMLEILKKH